MNSIKQKMASRALPAVIFTIFLDVLGINSFKTHTSSDAVAAGVGH